MIKFPYSGWELGEFVEVERKFDGPPPGEVVCALTVDGEYTHSDWFTVHPNLPCLECKARL